MEKVIIIGFTAKSKGVIIETNIPAKLKTGNVKGKTVFVSWDKIGGLLFENYTDIVDVELLNSIRNNSSLKEEVEKQYCMPNNINSKEEHEQYLKDIGYDPEKVLSVKILKDNTW